MGHPGRQVAQRRKTLGLAQIYLHDLLFPKTGHHVVEGLLERQDFPGTAPRGNRCQFAFANGRTTVGKPYQRAEGLADKIHHQTQGDNKNRYQGHDIPVSKSQ
ncbi:MAG: hypothetical protein BWX80_03698 [Candidatus Hydrogenedentes bacterium ADurb.Bin101]|nr:MAG: hypothetical protein BWX80_03698 [Candidatus Hydrogenedentes bacterium ADurb.Bin101]